LAFLELVMITVHFRDLKSRKFDFTKTWKKKWLIERGSLNVKKEEKNLWIGEDLVLQNTENLL